MTAVLVTPRSLAKADHPALEPLIRAGFEIIIPSPGRTPSPADLAAVLPGCSGWLAGVEPITAALMELAPNLKVIARNGVGVDNVDVQAAKARGIQVAVTPGANARGVAELALLLILAMSRGLVDTNNSIKEGDWRRSQGFELEGKTLGLAGCGQIGRLLSVMAMGLGMKVVATDIKPNSAFICQDFSYLEMNEMLGKVDVLSLHMPGTGAPLLDEGKIALLKPGCLVVNTARSSLVEPGAMLAALDSGHIRGYGVDVFDSEPPGITPLTTHPKVVCSAHIGGFTKESVMRAAHQAAENIVQALRG